MVPGFSPHDLIGRSFLDTPHMIYDIKHDGRNKSRLFDRGHLAPERTEIIFSGVVSLSELRLVIFIAELSNLKLCGGNVSSAYLEVRKFIS
jgi:hypothetical protein